MSPPLPLVERFLSKIRNNRFAATLIIIGIVVTSLASFTDALTKLFAVLPELRKTNIVGSWQSEMLTDTNTGRKYRYSFLLKADGPQVYGSAVRTAPSCQGSNAVACSGFGKPVGITEGKLEKNMLSFVCDWGEIPGRMFWTHVKTKQSFRGVVKGTSIQFLVQDNQSSPPFEFVASQLEIGKGAVP